MPEASTEKVIRETRALVQERVKELRARHVGQRVTLTAAAGPTAQGREAVIEHVAFIDGDVLFLCMVERVDGEGPLNTKPWSRSYRPWSHFKEIA